MTLESDKFNRQAVEMIGAASTQGEQLLVHSYMLVESAALLQRRLGSEASLLFLSTAASFETVWVDGELHTEALRFLSRKGTSAVSLVDAVSFLIMRSHGITNYIGFDKHFLAAGFTQYLSE